MPRVPAAKVHKPFNQGSLKPRPDAYDSVSDVERSNWNPARSIRDVRERFVYQGASLEDVVEELEA